MTSVWKALAITAAMGLGLPAYAGEAAEPAPDDWFPGEFSGNVALYSDYTFRGVSQTKESMALQGGIDWAHEGTGLYFGTWASSVKFAEDDSSYLELDVYTGWAKSFGDFSVDLGTVWYHYPKNNDLDYWEFVLGTGYDLGFASVSAGYLWSPDYFGILGDGHYISAGIEVPLPYDLPYGFDLTFDVQAGITLTDKDVLPSGDEYVDWQVGMVWGLPKGLSLDMRYVDTDEKEDITDSRFVFGLGYSF